MLVLDGIFKELRKGFSLFLFFKVGHNLSVMIERDSWSSLYFAARGEIRRSAEDKQMRKHRTRMFSLIKSDSQGIEED